MPRKSPKTENAANLKPIYVIAGKERRRVMDALNALTERLLGDADPQVALSNFDGAAVELAGVLDELRTAPFLAPLRVVVVKEADSFITKYRQALEAYLEQPSATGVLILVAESFPKTTRIAKQVDKIGELLTCEPLKPYHLAPFLVEYAKKTYRLTLPPDAASLLIELSGDDSGILMAEVDKIAAYLADPQKRRTAISLDDIQLLVGHNRQFNVFNVIDAMTTGQTALALQKLDAMMTQDRDAQYTAVGAFAWHFRRLYQARIMSEDRQADDRSICVTAKVWNHQDAFMKQVRRLSLPVVAGLLRELMLIDWSSKTGGLSVQQGLEALILKCADGKTRSA